MGRKEEEREKEGKGRESGEGKARRDMAIPFTGAGVLCTMDLLQVAQEPEEEACSVKGAPRFGLRWRTQGAALVPDLQGLCRAD